MGYILKEDVVRRCEAIRALALKSIDEWSAHTLEYKEQPAQQLYITDKYARLREMRDILMFLEDLPDENVREDIQAHWIFDDFDGDGLDYQCSHCNFWARSSWNYCPRCGAYMIGVKR